MRRIPGWLALGLGVALAAAGRPATSEGCDRDHERVQVREVTVRTDPGRVVRVGRDGGRVRVVIPHVEVREVVVPRIEVRRVVLPHRDGDLSADDRGAVRSAFRVLGRALGRAFGRAIGRGARSPGVVANRTADPDLRHGLADRGWL